MKTKVALFDIDKTLIRGDSLFSLYRYGRRKWPFYYLFMPVIPFAYLLYVLHIIPRVRMKEFYYRPLERFTDEDYEIFFDRYVLNKTFREPFEKLVSLKKEGFHIVMATASPYAYMRLWEKKGYADKVIGTTVAPKNGLYDWRIIGPNNSGKEKVNRIEAYFNETGIVPDYENSVGFSDSDKDIPMLSLVKNRYRVDSEGHISDFV